MQQRPRQQSEAFRRNQAKQKAFRQLQQKQQQGYQVIQDWDGQLYLIPPYQSSTGSVNDDSFKYNTDTDDACSKLPVDHDRMTISIHDRMTISIHASDQTTTSPENNKTGFTVKTKIPKRQLEDVPKIQKKESTTAVVEDVVSDCEEDGDDVSATLEKTLRNRRPSPGQWLEPVELIV